MRKYKQPLSLLMCLAMLLSLMPMTVFAADSLTVTIDTGASVTLSDSDSDGYYDIGTTDELYAFAAAVNSGNTTINGELTADITVNENVLNADGTLNGAPARAWTPIGTKEQPYAGVFNGNNKTISGLYYNNSASNYVGLFGYASATGGKIQYITINDSYFCGNNCVGAVVGRSYITLYQCISNSTVVGNTYIGGVVGYSEYYSIERSANYKEVTGKEYVGGIVGYCSGDVDYSINYGNVTGERSIGGISGYIGGMSSCGINVGNVYGSSYVGAIFGYITSGGTHGYGYYLEDCATTDEGTVQKGVGESGTGSYEFNGTDTVAVSAERFASGEIAYIATYYQLKQNIGTDPYPTFTGATVYRYKDCANNYYYTNNEELSGTTSDHIWENGVCTVCGVSCAHDSYSEGFCTVCGAECPHTWSNYVCNLCGVKCTHESYTKGICDKCGKICSHSYNSSNKCTICGFAKILYSGTCSSTNDTPTWTLDADGVLTVSGTGEMEERPWSTYKSQITKVVIEDGVTSICMYAFDSYYNLKNVSIADSVTTIGESAFYSCSGLTEIDIPDGVTSIGNYAFSRCTGLTEIDIPDGVTSISKQAFYKCTGLTEITIPNSVTSFGTSALSGCSSLTDVYYDGYENRWNQITIGEYNESLTSATIHFKECTVHSWTEGVCGNCGEICEHSYTDGTCTICGMTSPYIAQGTCGDDLTWTLDADGVLTISGTGAMKDYYNNDQNFPWYQHLQSIKTLVVEEGITKISSHAFEYCSSLTEVTLSKGLSVIDTRAFSKCTNLTSITLPESLYNISAYAFEGCVNLTSITIPAKTTSIFPSAFSRCSGLNGIWVDPNNTAYSNDSFGVLLNKAQTRICIAPVNLSGDYVCPETVTRIGNNAFEGCSKITSVTMSGLVSTIEYNAFSGCGSLTEITIPDTVTSVEEYAFSNCNKLTDIYYGGTEAEWGSITVGSNNSPLTSATIHYEACIYTGSHTFTDGVCTQCGEAQFGFYGTNTTLGTVLDLNFAVEKSHITDEGSYAKLVRTYADGTTHEVTLAKSDWTEQGELYLITYEDLAAKEMCDEVSVCIFNSADVQISQTKTDSIRSYAMRCITDDTGKYTAAAKVLLMKMLDYGAEAQIEFKHNTSDPANKEITDVMRTAYPFTQQTVTNNGSEVAGQYMGTSLILENSIEMQMGFYGDPTGVSAAVSYIDHYGKEQSFGGEDVKIATYTDTETEETVAYGVIIPEIVVADARQPVTVTVTLADSSTITVTDSMASYAARHNSEGVYGAIIDFADAAYAYFRSLETT